MPTKCLLQKRRMMDVKFEKITSRVFVRPMTRDLNLNWERKFSFTISVMFGFLLGNGTVISWTS